MSDYPTFTATVPSVSYVTLPPTLTPPGFMVRCFFEGVPDPPEPFDLLFARVPNQDESVMYRESRWFVTRVTWTSEGPYLDLSYGDL